MKQIAQLKRRIAKRNRLITKLEYANSEDQTAIDTSLSSSSIYNEDGSINRDVLEYEIKWREDHLSKIAYHTKSTLKINNELRHFRQLESK